MCLFLVDSDVIAELNNELSDSSFESVNNESEILLPTLENISDNGSEIGLTINNNSGDGCHGSSWNLYESTDFPHLHTIW